VPNGLATLPAASPSPETLLDDYPPISIERAEALVERIIEPCEDEQVLAFIELLHGITFAHLDERMNAPHYRVAVESLVIAAVSRAYSLTEDFHTALRSFSQKVAESNADNSGSEGDAQAQE
jgi:hypothetical protein